MSLFTLKLNTRICEKQLDCDISAILISYVTAQIWLQYILWTQWCSYGINLFLQLYQVWLLQNGCKYDTDCLKIHQGWKWKSYFKERMLLEKKKKKNLQIMALNGLNKYFKRKMIQLIWKYSHSCILSSVLWVLSRISKGFVLIITEKCMSIWTIFLSYIQLSPLSRNRTGVKASLINFWYPLFSLSK